jgi:hypothetical protein
VVSREVRAPVDRAPADGVEHERGDRRGGGVDGIVGWKLSNVRVGVEIGQAVDFPVEQRLRLNPTALLETDDVKPASARLQATAPPEAPAPTIRTSGVSQWAPVACSAI